jgi:hypothetical protein
VGEHTLYIDDWKGDQRLFPLGTNVTPRRQSFTPAGHLHPGGQLPPAGYLFPLWAKLKPGRGHESLMAPRG